MTYNENLCKRMQDILNEYFNNIKTFTDTDALENELFLIKQFLFNRQAIAGMDTDG